MENKKENKNGKITLEKLAGMVARGFDRTTADLFEVKNKLSEHDKRFNKLEFQVDEMYDILKHFEENDILNLQKRVQILEKAVRALAGQTPK